MSSIWNIVGGILGDPKKRYMFKIWALRNANISQQGIGMRVKFFAAPVYHLNR